MTFFREEFKAKLDDWLKGKPSIIKDVVAKYPPYKRWRNTETGQLGYIYSYSEDGTVTITFPEEWNPQQLTPGWKTRTVFGIDPSILEEVEHEQKRK